MTRVLVVNVVLLALSACDSDGSGGVGDPCSRHNDRGEGLECRDGTCQLTVEPPDGDADLGGDSDIAGFLFAPFARGTSAARVGRALGYSTISV